MKTTIEKPKSTTRKSRFPLFAPHLTTQDVAQFKPLMVYELIAGDTLDCKVKQISDSVPTAVKTYGAFKLRHFVHWCPKRIAWRNYNYFKSGSVDSSLNIVPPYFTMKSFAQEMFQLSVIDPGSPNIHYRPYDTDFATVMADQTTQTYDFLINTIAYDEGGETEIAKQWRIKLTAKGRLVYQIMITLGYNLPNQVMGPMIGDQSSLGSNLEDEFDATPLLSMLRFFYDYAYPSDYLQQQGFGSLFETNGAVNALIFHRMIQLIFVGVSSDFFTQLWIRPNQKALGSGSSQIARMNVGSQYIGDKTAIGEPNTSGDAFGMSVGSGSLANVLSEYKFGSTNPGTAFSAQGLKWLESLTDYVIRNNIGGTRFNEWLRSHFGFVTSDETCEISSLIKMWTDVVSFNGVEATTGTDVQLLGQRAAVGMSSGGNRIKFDAKEDGFLMVYVMVVPDSAYYQGQAPWTERLTSKFQLYTPELDGVDMEPVPLRQLAYGAKDFREIGAASPARMDDAFGFAPRYSRRYKIPYSMLSGDFRIGTRNTGMDAYHTFRDVFYGRNSTFPLALDARFRQADNQYDRVFAVHPTDDDDSQSHDKIRTLYIFDAVKYSNMLPYGDSLPFMDDDNVGSVSLDNGGTDIL